MRKFLLLIIMSFLLMFNLFAQKQVSRTIQIPYDGKDLYDYASTIEAYQSDFIIQCDASIDYFRSDSVEYVATLARIDAIGDTVWVKQIPTEGKHIYTGAEESIIMEDSSFIAIFHDSNNEFKDNTGILLARLNYDGEIMDTNYYDIDTQYSGIRGLKKWGDEYLHVYDTDDGDVLFQIFDEDLDLVESHEFRYSRYAFGVKIEIISDEEFMVSYQDVQDGLYGRFALKKYNREFEVLDEFIGFRTVYDDLPLNVDFGQTSDGGVLGVFYRDTIHPEFPSGKDSQRFFKLTADFELDWEFVQLSILSKYLQKIEQVSSTEHLVIGYQNYYSIHNYKNNDGLSSWVMLMTESGEVKWERYIYDIRSDIWSHCIDGLKTESGGYAFIGFNRSFAPDTSEYPNPSDTYFFTLDENGCWNGNCDSLIVILDDSTSVRILNTEEEFLTQEEVKVFPNPTSGTLTLEHKNAGNRKMKIFNSQGKLLYTEELYARKSTINLSGYQSGIYYVTVYDMNGRKLQTKKIIVK